MSITVAFRYGSPNAESIGDCVLTEDNSYILVLFNTKHYMDRKTYSTTTSTKPIDYNLAYPTINNVADWIHPYVPDGVCYSTCA